MTGTTSMQSHRSQSSRLSLLPIPDALLIGLAILAMRFLFLGDAHVDVDEQFYMLTGARMLDGAVPFVDIWDRKPVGLFLIYAFAALFGKGIWAYEIMALLSVTATALILYAMARTYADRPTALLVGIGYGAIVNLLDGMGGQSPVFYNLLMTVSAALVMRQFVPGRVACARSLLVNGVVVMLLCGIAIQVKYLVIGEGFFFGIVLLWLALRRHGFVAALGMGIVWVAIALLPTAMAVAGYAVIGKLDALMFANFESIFLRPNDPIRWILDRLLAIASVLAVPTGIGIAGLFAKGAQPLADDARPCRRFALGWVAAAWIAFIVFGTYFKHYALPLAGPTMLLFACASGRWLRLRAIVILLATLWGVRSAYITSESEASTATLDRIVAQMGETRNCPFVFRGPSIVYHLGDFCLPTAYVFPYFLNHNRENPTLGVKPNEELARVIAGRPDFILMRWPMYDYSQSSLAILLPVLEQDYQKVLDEKQRRGEALILYRLRPGVRPLPNNIGAGGKVGAGWK